mmetsp:Transcript_24257/g.38422  ORF Transcript_24257/g.38422 Transcript_24257/m.38422 type:complete len:322 (+) Transcript_24257:220-1185(+)
MMSPARVRSTWKVYFTAYADLLSEAEFWMQVEEESTISLGQLCNAARNLNTVKFTDDDSGILTFFPQAANNLKDLWFEEVEKQKKFLRGCMSELKETADRMGRIFARLLEFHHNEGQDILRSSASSFTSKEERSIQPKDDNSSAAACFDFKAELQSFYQKYNPEKLGDVESTLSKYAGRERVLFQKLYKKYKVPQDDFNKKVGSPMRTSPTPGKPDIHSPPPRPHSTIDVANNLAEVVMRAAGSVFLMQRLLLMFEKELWRKDEILSRLKYELIHTEKGESVELLEIVEEQWSSQSSSSYIIEEVLKYQHNGGGSDKNESY